MKALEIGEVETHCDMSKQETNLINYRKEYIEIEIMMLCKLT